ncbi:hypothetical protein [Haloterrigena alkaliphila]|uniref:hypothetical protein n=1 Tax=Haloterrigena alkaliphila TaxID=2816475 RepID=UPI001CFFD13E|nr:hypothetical protein [Haloterrigena alkaliphila]UHQ95073.1 hypothetical protein J0X25_19645 [Haloterrigena alkaliphila]
MADSYNSSEASHRALRAIQQELERHPIVTAVQGFAELRADLAVERWEIERENATLTVHWFAGETPDARPEFEFHYSDEETDFGWHHHEQEHVDGWRNFQERAGDAGYTYEPHTFQAQNPAQFSWEIMSLVSPKLTPE